MSLTQSDIIVFLGPSLPQQLASNLLLADYRPPAGQGDIYRAVKESPKIIVLIDGVFENQPAVWHKEILYALSKGILVYGSSSMGALRAAELSMYGMQGIGWVYESLVNERLTDDDEVTITHAPEALDFQPTSEAMVNIRVSLQAAVKAEVISAAQANALIAQSKQRWYPQRQWSTVLIDAKALLSSSEHQALDVFLQSNRIDIKQQDAKALLDDLCRLRQQETLPTFTPTFDFVHTDAWQALVDDTDKKIAAQRVDIQHIQQELALLNQYASYANKAKIAQLQQALSPRAHSSNLHAALQAFTQKIEATTPDNQPDLEKVQAWLSEQKLSIAAFDELIKRQAKQLGGEKLLTNCTEQLVDLTRLNGKYLSLIQRASHKQRLLSAKGIAHVTLEDTHLSAEQLTKWYFEDYLKQAIPTELSQHVKEQGFTDRQHFLRVMLQEYLYLSALQENQPE